MRISVHLCQRKFLNKHLRFSIHDFHVFVHPPLVVKSYAPRFCHVWTFPVSLVMSPVHAMRVFCPFNLRMAANTCMNADTLSVEQGYAGR